MAYNERFYHTYCDRYGNEYRISLRQKDYVGEATAQHALPEPWKIERELPQSVKKGGVLGSKATAYFLTDSSFSLMELYSAQEDTYQLVRLKNGEINWIGFVPPDGIVQGGWDGQRVSLEINAADRLASLQGTPFVDGVGENYGQKGDNIKSFLWVIKECLLKTNLVLNVRTLVDMKSREQGGVRIVTVKLSEFLGNMLINFPGDQAGAQSLKNSVVPGSNLKVTYDSGTVENYVASSSTVNFGGGINWSVEIDTTPAFTGTNINAQMQITPPSGEDPQDLDPLLATDHDVRVWIRDSDVEGKTYFQVRGGALNCYEVLNYIAAQWNFILYQSEGRWVIKRWNIDKVDNIGYRWFDYNPQGEAIGRTPYQSPVIIPCVASQEEFRLFGSTLGMDRVLKNVITNYRFNYKQEGDSFLNLITNGNMTGPFNPLPFGWTRYDLSTGGWGSGPDPFLPISVSKVTTGLPPDVEEALQLRGGNAKRYFSNLTDQSVSYVNKGDSLKIKFKQKIVNMPPNSQVTRPTSDLGTALGITLYNTREEAFAEFRGDPIRRYNMFDLVNNTDLDFGTRKVTLSMGASWHDPNSVEGIKRRKFIAPIVKELNVIPASTMQEITIITDPVPVSGFVAFSVLGISGNLPFGGNWDWWIENGSVEIVNPVTGAQQTNWLINITNSSNGVALNLAQFSMIRVVDPKNEAVPQIDPFMYPSFQDQLTRNYSDTIDEIEVLTGDDYGSYSSDRISGMSYKGFPTSMWDTWDERYGWSRQGLITAKSVIEMYWKPSRMINCEINLPGITWDSIFEIEELPGYKFIMLRGEISGPHESFKGVLSEVYSPLDELLPPGGQDGNGTIDPKWERTGVTRCKKGINGQNTGMVEGVERDINQASATYGEERWVDIGADNVSCPIGDPVDLLWGESVLATPSSLRYYPYVKNGFIYTVAFNGDGSNKFLRLIYKASLGSVRSVTYEDRELSSGAWVYETDINIDGIVYKSLKLQWPVGVFTGLNVNFEIY